MINYKHYLQINNIKDSPEAFRAYLDKHDDQWQAMPPKMQEQCFSAWYNLRFISNAWM